jgi:hypothetical protein
MAESSANGLIVITEFPQPDRGSCGFLRLSAHRTAARAFGRPEPATPFMQPARAGGHEPGFFLYDPNTTLIQHMKSVEFVLSFL